MMSGSALTVEQLKASPSVLPYSHPDYRPPTTEEVAFVMALTELSQRKTALVTGSQSNVNGSPTVRRWKTSPTSKSYRPIPYSAWRLLLEYAGIATTEETRAAIRALDY